MSSTAQASVLQADTEEDDDDLMAATLAEEARMPAGAPFALPLTQAARGRIAANRAAAQLRAMRRTHAAAAASTL